MNGTEAPAPEVGPAVTRLDRPVLMGNLVAGGFWLLVLAALGGWVLSLVGAVYVAAASVFLAAVYGRESLNARQEAWAWFTGWLAAVLLWAWVTSGIEGGDSSWLLNLWFGLILGTGCYLAWQLLALVIRLLMAQPASTAPSRQPVPQPDRNQQG